MSLQGSGQYRGNTPQYFNHDVSAATLQLAPGLSYESTTVDGHTYVNVAGANMNPNTSVAHMPMVRSMLPMPYQHHGYAPQYPPMTYQPMYSNNYVQAPIRPMPPQQQQPAKPIQQRKKNLLNFVDPTTQESIFGENPAIASATSTETVNKRETPVPVPEQPQQITEANRTSSDDIRHQFAINVGDRYKQGKDAEAMKGTNDASSEPKTEVPTEKIIDAAKEIKESSTESDQKIDSPVETTPQKDESAQVTRAVSETPATTSEHEMTPVIVVDQVANEQTTENEEKVETNPVVDKAAELKDYENKVEEYFNDGENIKAIKDCVYPRKFIQLLRSIIKKFEIVDCPLSEEKLRGFLIDRGTMPQPANVSMNKSRYTGGRVDNFNPSWNNKPAKQYQGRYSDNKQKRTQQRPPVVARQSIQRAPVKKLERGKDAWVPTSQQKTNVESIPDRIEKTKKEIRGLLNKITPSTYADLSVEFINKKVWQDGDTLPTVVDLVFTKAVEEPTFVGVYSDLCKVQHEAEAKSDNSKEFYQAVVRKCQTIFEGTTDTPAKSMMKKVEEQLKTEEDAKKKVLLKEELEDWKGKEKRYMLGTIKFISHLFRIKFLNWKVINFCIIRLIKTAEESMSELDIEFCINLLETVGSFMEQTERSELSKYVDYVGKFKANVTSRVKFMIMGLEDLRTKNWQQKDQGPKTKEEIKTEVLKEEAQNKRERETYEVAKKPYTGRASGQQPYIGRPSRDKTDRKANAVLNSSNAGGKEMPKPKLDKVDNVSALKPQRKSNKPTTEPSSDGEGWKRVV